MTKPSALPQSSPDFAHRALAISTLARFHHWGLRDYTAILALQESLRTARQADQIPDTWLAGEHPTVITQGVRGAASDFIGTSRFPVVKIDRGGQTTIHNPGQLVIYCIVRTHAGLTAQARMSRALLAAARDWIATLAGVRLEIQKGRPGLFETLAACGPPCANPDSADAAPIATARKAAAIGISIRGRVTMHGIAINLCNDLAPWRAIVPCGEPETRPVTLSELAGRKIEPAEFIAQIPQWLKETWGYEAVKIESLESLTANSADGR